MAAASPVSTQRRSRRWLRTLGVLAAAAAVLLAAGLLWLRAELRASLPLEDGERRLAGLQQPVRVERDALGVPVVRGASRLDVARATGFIHAQERFFQMDVLRRRAAGELAELAGDKALKLDREVRFLRLRAVAQRTLESLGADERALLEAYAAGASAGLGALRAAPFEYRLLRTRPVPWRAEDSLLCALAMYVRLQGELPIHESTLGVLHDTLPAAVFEFLAPKGGEWDAPLEGEPFAQAPVPGPGALDLRGSPPSAPADVPVALAVASDVVLGSNNWAVAGSHTAHGGALLANDMHLGLSVPNTWYRASLVVESPAGAGTRVTRVTGVTLPGAPFIVAGSNGRVAWGFTNSEGDWADLVVLEPAGTDPDVYRTPEGPRRLERASETIRVRGGKAERVDAMSTVYGPVLDRDHAGRRRALAWVALREGGLNVALLRLESAGSPAEAQAIAAQAGMPHQNLVVAGADGHIGWTIIGRIPRRFGHDGRLPTSWADGTRGWDGWLEAEDYPRIVDPASGRLYTANARVASGENLRRIGFGGYALGARQRQIRDDLLALQGASEADMLRVQLDDRALFLERWQRLLSGVLTAASVEGHPLRAEARRLVQAWGGRASPSSAGYTIVRAFRERVADLALGPLLAPCRTADPRFDYLGRSDARHGQRQWEGPLWALVSERPAHLLDPRHASWDDLLLRAADDVLAELSARSTLGARTWGRVNSPLIRHPLSGALPGFGRLLDMEHLEIPGDGHMPRVQTPGEGASERFAVSPGREERGYFHMPTGQSGHPLSRHYADGHAAWATGQPTPFLPGPAVHVLTLVPSP